MAAVVGRMLAWNVVEVELAVRLEVASAEVDALEEAAEEEGEPVASLVTVMVAAAEGAVTAPGAMAKAVGVVGPMEAVKVGVEGLLEQVRGVAMLAWVVRMAGDTEARAVDEKGAH